MIVNDYDGKMKGVRDNKGVVFTYLSALFIAWLLIFLLRHFCFDFMLVEGVSMKPTLQAGDRQIVNKFSVYFSKPNRNDIVLFNLSQNNHILVKRVIAVEGDKVFINAGKVYINDKMLIEPYVFVDAEKGFDNTFLSSRIVPKGHVFVLGDNRNNSIDSRSAIVGMVKVSDIIGYVVK